DVCLWACGTLMIHATDHPSTRGSAMFISLLVVTFIIAAATSSVVAYFLHKPVAAILSRIIADELALAWQRYVIFGVYLVGITGGVRIWELERYVSPSARQGALELNTDRWALEI